MPDRPTSSGNANAQRLVLVNGATGHQGGAAARHLRQRGFPVRTITRDPDKPAARALCDLGIEVMQGDYDDPRSLAKALDEVYGVFSVQQHAGGDVASETRRGRSIASAAQRAQISHFVYSSAAGADRPTGIPFFESKQPVEQHVRNLGMPWTILRPVFFMENWLGMADALKSGTLTLPLTPDCRFQQIAVDDIGGIAATAFEHPARWHGRAVEIASDELPTAQVAATLGKALGREVRYRQAPFEDFERMAGADHTKMFRWFQEEGPNADIAALRYDYPQLTRFENWVGQQDWEHAGGAAAARAR